MFFLVSVKLKPIKGVPVLVASAVIALVCGLRVLDWQWCERLERMTFDMRARQALRFSRTATTNLGFVYIDEDSLRRVANGSLGFRFGREWPRQVYGRLVHELAEQGARAIAIDIIFAERRPDHPPVLMADGSVGPESDEFFAAEMRRAGNVILALTPQTTLPRLFLTNAAALGDILTDKDEPEGVLRRAKAFRMYRRWHPAFQQMEADPEFGVDLRRARVEPGRIVLPRRGLEPITIPLDGSGNFDLADFGGDRLPAGVARKAKPFTEERIWHMGLQLAARELKLDLNQTVVDLPGRQIVLGGEGGLRRIIPVDRDGSFYVDWSLTEDDPRLTLESIQDLLAEYRVRLTGHTNDLDNRWRDKLVLVGSSAVVGNNLTDRGATPVRADTLLVSEHWNVANSIILGRFITRSSLWFDVALIALLGVLSGFVTWRLRVLVASGVVIVLLVAYVASAVAIYTQTRHWLPVILPVFGALLMTHITLVTWRVVFEQAQRRRVKSIFSTIVSPKIVNELLQAETLSLEGARREVTVFFADVRGFTELTDSSQERIAELVRNQHLTDAAAKSCFDDQARDTLATVNLYLGLVADKVVAEDGTLDKFIGDCVMAFWGAPTVNPRHAVACVRAALQAQRAIYELNRQRAAENRLREVENRARVTAGLPALPLFPILFLGTGINTGVATVGLMGSAAKTVVRQVNYTVFGREVNLASRLESASGRGRIYIGENTYRHLLRDDPELAAACVALPAQRLKGISSAVTAYEVAWRAPGSLPLDLEFATTSGLGNTSLTAFVRRG
ncbi:MAG TPA: adenylate/guanylate cyclase domain-containing protein [Verrucomicrobiae bacterium]